MKTPSIIQTDVSLKNFSTLKIGGVAKFFASPSSEIEITEIVEWAKVNNITYFVIGHGSNLLFEDDGYQGLIIKLADNFSQIKIDDESLFVQAGAWMPYIARKTQVAGLTGLEHTVGIPGSIGGIVTMNAGSQRKSVSTNLVKIRFLDENCCIKEIKTEDCNFAYRKSIFQLHDWVILQAEFALSKGDKNAIRHEMRTILRQRRLKFPRKQPNCGSVFKSNPAMYEQFGPPGKIIEQLNLKGLQIGGMRVSDMHANFFLNTGGASSQDFKEILNKVKSTALQTLGVELEEEVINVRVPKKNKMDKDGKR